MVLSFICMFGNKPKLFFVSSCDNVDSPKNLKYYIKTCMSITGSFILVLPSTCFSVSQLFALGLSISTVW